MARCPEKRLRQFAAIEELDTAILYTLELTSSLSVFPLVFGLIAYGERTDERSGAHAQRYHAAGVVLDPTHRY